MHRRALIVNGIALLLSGCFFSSKGTSTSSSSASTSSSGASTSHSATATSTSSSSSLSSTGTSGGSSSATSTASSGGSTSTSTSISTSTSSAASTSSSSSTSTSISTSTSSAAATTSTPSAASTSTSSASSSSSSSGSSGTSSATSSTASSSSSSSSSSSGGPPGSLRFANLAFDPEPVDFCLALHGQPLPAQGIFTSLTTPLAQDGLDEPQVSPYFSLPSGSYDVTVIATNSSTNDACAGGFVLASTSAPIALSAGGFETLAMLGSSFNQTLELKSYGDDDPSGLPSSAQVRVLSDSIGYGNVDLGSGFGATFQPWVQQVAYGAIGVPSGADALGYAAWPAANQGVISFRDHATGADAEIDQGPALPSGGYGTLILRSSAADSVLPAALLCDDSAPLTSSGLVPCTVLPREGAVRFADMGPSSSNADVCIAPAGTFAFQWRLAELVGADGGFATGEVSAYTALPSGYYDFYWVPVGASCPPDAGTYPPVFYSGAANRALGYGTSSYLTFLAVGNTASGGDEQTFTLSDESAVPSTATAGQVTVRYVDAEVGLYGSSLGTGTYGQPDFAALFASVALGSTDGSGSGEVDSLGYAQLTPDTGLTFSVGSSASTTPNLVQTNYSLPDPSLTSKVVTVFSTGDINYTPQVAPGLIQVDDQALPINGLLPTH